MKSRPLGADGASAQLRGYSFYSQDLLYHLFRYPYPRIEFVEELAVSRLTASKCLNQLAEPDGLLQKHKLERANYYANQPLSERLARLGEGVAALYLRALVCTTF